MGQLCNKLKGRGKAPRYMSIGTDQDMGPDTAMAARHSLSACKPDASSDVSQPSATKGGKAKPAPKLQALKEAPPAESGPIPLLKGPPGQACVPTKEKTEHLEARLMAAARHVEKLAASLEAQLTTISDQTTPVKNNVALPVPSVLEPLQPAGSPCLMVLNEPSTPSTAVNGPLATSLADAPQDLALVVHKDDDMMSNVGLQKHEQIRATRMNTEARVREAMRKSNRLVD